MTEQELIDICHVHCPYCKGEVVLMGNLPKAVTREEWCKRLRAELDADKERRKAARREHD